nr:ABC transporter permease [Streptomyces sp. DSM 41633]
MSVLLSRPGGAPPTDAPIGLVDPRAAVRRVQRKPVVPRAVQRLLGPVLLVGMWQLLSTVGIFDERTVPPPTRVLDAAWTLIADGTFQDHLTASLLRVGYGLVFGIVLGLGLALISGLSR